MDTIDVLGEDYQRYNVFSKDLLAETDDIELQEIVKNAAQQLNSPMALVSLILDNIQFFKAHTGLPEILATSRGTHRDASFCQFVVRDGATFEINDAALDPRIPQHVVKEFNIQSYLGVPIKIKELVVGSLCVLDNKKRKFTEEEHENINELAKLVNNRLSVLTENRRKNKLNLTFRTIDPALEVLSSSLQPIQGHVNLSYVHAASIRSFLNIAERLVPEESSDTIKMSFEAAKNAHRQIEEHVLEIEMNMLNSKDSLKAIKNLTTDLGDTQLSEVLSSAQDLTRNATRAAGGFPMPELLSDRTLRIKGDFAIAIISNCLLMISSEIKRIDGHRGIRLVLTEQEELVTLKFKAKELSEQDFEMVSEQLNLLIGEEHPAVNIESSEKVLNISLHTIKR